MEELQGRGELPDQPPDLELWAWPEEGGAGGEETPQRSLVAVLQHDGQLALGVPEVVQVGHYVAVLLQSVEDLHLLIGHLGLSNAEESLHGNSVSPPGVCFPLLYGAEIDRPEASRAESFDFLEVSLLRVVGTRVSHNYSYLVSVLTALEL